jgi:hypothetical protein
MDESSCDPKYASIIREHARWLPKMDVPAGSAARTESTKEPAFPLGRSTDQTLEETVKPRLRS